MNVDPTGHFAISTFLICLSVGALIGFGAAYGSDVIKKVQEDGFQWSDIIYPLL